MKKKVVLYSPQQNYDSADTPYAKHILPVALLSIAGGAEADGYEVVIVDGQLYDQEEAHRRLLEACEGAFLYGTTGILGYQVSDGFVATTRVKERFPDLTSIIGGWFATSSPVLQLETGLYDAVVLGQGEDTLREILAAMSSGEPFDSVPGLALWRDGEVVTTDPRGAIAWNKREPTAWHLLDFEPYREAQLRQRGKREWESIPAPPCGHDQYVTLSYYSSYGCPLACTFCCSPEASGLRWKAQPADEMVGELVMLQERFDFDTVFYMDANYGVMEKRVRGVAEGLIDAGVHLWQSAYAQAPSIARYDEETLVLMRKSGMYQVLIGGETGTEETMKLVKKTTKPGENEAAAKRLAAHDITPMVTYILGLPGEDEASMKATLDEVRRMYLACPESSPQVWPFRPLPGTPTFHEAVEMGYEPPTDLFGWGALGDYRVHDSWPGNLPPLISRRRQMLNHFTTLARGMFGERHGFWQKRAKRRLESGDWRFARIEAKAFDLYLRVAGV